VLSHQPRPLLALHGPMATSASGITHQAVAMPVAAAVGVAVGVQSRKV
jgi:hypothetical protein